MAAIRTRTGIPDTFGGMATKLMDSLPKGYCRYDVVADAYKDRSIKIAERIQRGVGEKYIIKGSNIKIPTSQSFLQMGLQMGQIKLSSNQEDDDTKIALHIKHVTLKNPGPVVVRSHSGDTHIPVLLIALSADTDQTIYLDNGHGNHRKVLDLESCEMTMLSLVMITYLPFLKKDRKSAGPYCKNTHSSWTSSWNLELIGSQMNI